MITAAGLHYRVGGRTVLSDVDVTVRPGRLLAVVGPNGAGKSTLLALLAGDLRPSAGAVWLDGAPVRAMRPRELARRRAVMPQQTQVQFSFTAAEVVGLGLYARHGHDDPDLIESALRQVDAVELAGRAFPTLSGGEQARVTFARVLAQDTPVLLLDEPTAHLDLHHQHLVLRLARTAAEQGGAVAVVLHDLNLAARFADELVVLAGGRVAASGPPETTLTAAALSTTYGEPITVVPHPLDGRPLVVPGASPIGMTSPAR